MNGMNFSDVCKAFFNHMKKKEMTPISRALLGIFTNDEKVLNENGEPYFIDVKEFIEFFKGELEIYPNIKTAAENATYLGIEDAIISIYDTLVKFEEHDNVAEELSALLDSDKKIDAVRKESIVKTDDIYQKTAKIFLYAMENSNNVVSPIIKHKKPTSIKNNLDLLKEIISTLPKPVMIEVPDEMDISEMTYVSAILEAFAEDAGVSLITQGELLSKSEYSKYKKKLERYRRDYYAAESIRESLKDTNLLNEDNFDELKDDTYDAIIDKVECDYDTSYDRMVETLTHVGTVSLNTLIAQIPGWVMASQKKGLCHILVNEKRIKWEDE